MTAAANCLRVSAGASSSWWARLFVCTTAAENSSFQQGEEIEINQSKAQQTFSSEHLFCPGAHKVIQVALRLCRCLHPTSPVTCPWPVCNTGFMKTWRLWKTRGKPQWRYLILSVLLLHESPFLPPIIIKENGRSAEQSLGYRRGATTFAKNEFDENSVKLKSEQVSTPLWETEWGREREGSGLKGGSVPSRHLPWGAIPRAIPDLTDVLLLFSELCSGSFNGKAKDLMETGRQADAGALLCTIKAVCTVTMALKEPDFHISALCGFVSPFSPLLSILLV